MILVPIITICILYLIYCANNESITRALANTWITSVSFIWITTELLSLFRIWTSITVLICWLVLFLILMYVGYKKQYKFQLKEVCGRFLSYKNEYAYRKWLFAFSIYYVILFKFDHLLVGFGLFCLYICFLYAFVMFFYIKVFCSN